MIIADLPHDEAERLAELNSYGVLDSQLEESFSNIVEIAAHICETPISLVSLVDPNRQWFKARYGIDAMETHRDIAFCSHSILGKTVFEVPNALEDIRFHDNPLVTSDPNIRAYFGAPLITSNGYQLGTLCVIDSVPRQLTVEQTTILSQLAAQVIHLLELRRSKQVAIKANKAKSEFLSSMSHELRTPLNSVLGFSQLLISDTEEPLTSSQMESVSYIINSGEHLLSLIGEVLDLAKIESGTVDIKLETIKLQTLIDDVCQMSKPQADKCSITIETKRSNDTLLTLTADYQKLMQVVLNMTSNAIKYNSKNGVVTLAWNKTTNDKIRISVSDTGKGVSEASFDALFEPFNRLDKANSSIEGTGIGLSICKQLVKLMEGEMGVYRNTDTGLTFWAEFKQA